jgi:hypothetical protein
MTKPHTPGFANKYRLGQVWLFDQGKNGPEKNHPAK